MRVRDATSVDVRETCVRVNTTRDDDDGATFARARPRTSTSAATTRRAMKIYTKTGDAGASDLYTMERREKDDATFDALGDVDECNVAVGIAREFCVEEKNGLAEELAEIQSRLLDVGSRVATPLTTSEARAAARAAFSEAHVEMLERRIDAMSEELPALTSFLLVSGGRASVFLHQARVVCRRAERRCVPLVRRGECPDVVRVYLNRLSDYMFTAARYAAMKAGRAEEPYKKAA